jgi:Uma2 family endonuclease
MAVHSPRKLTYEDFARFPENGRRHEILDGDHVVTSAPSWHHQRVLRAVFRRLDAFVASRGLGEVVFAPFAVVLSEHDVVEPDLFFLSSARTSLLLDDGVQGAPDLMVEVLSRSTRRRDPGKKLARYEKLGVPEFWVFDPEPASVQVFRREDDRFLLPSC